MKKLRIFLPLLILALAAALSLSACVKTGGSTSTDDDQPDSGSSATEGIVYEISEDGKYASVIGYDGTETNVVISESYEGVPVKVIADEAFMGVRTLISITLPESITEIGASAFSGCEWLSEIALPFGVSSIGESAFYNCKSLKSVDIPLTLKSIGESAFELCSELESVNVADIDSWVKIDFTNDTACPLYYADELTLDGETVTNVSLGNGVLNISKYALNISSLESLTISFGVKSIANGAFSSCTSLASLTVPYVGGGSEGTEFLGYIFGAESYERGAEFVPASLKTVNVSGAVPIADGAFFGLSSITDISFNANLKTIGEGAFSGCTSLKQIAVPKSVTAIGKGAFSGCTSLSALSLPFIGGSASENRYLGYIFGAESAELSSAAIPSTLENIQTVGGADIAENAFAGAASVLVIDISGDCKSIALGALSGCTSLQNLQVPFIGGSETANTYFGYVFGAASADSQGANIPASLISVILKNPVDIAENAFSGCTSLKSVSLPMGIKSIGAKAFFNCSGLSAILIPYTVDTVGAQAFYGCSSVRIFAMAKSRPSGWDRLWKESTTKAVWKSAYTAKTDDGILYSQTLEEITVLGFETEASHITIPQTINGYTVVAIGEEAFSANVTLQSVTLPSTLIRIGYKAFSGCYNLTSITLPDNLEVLDEGAFYSCGFSEIFIPKSVTTLGASSLSYCSNLKKITFEDGSRLESIGAWAFKMSSNLSEVYFSDLGFWCAISFEDEYSNPMTYAKSIYVGGELLSTIAVPEGITEIKSYCFTGSMPRIIILPSSVTSIGASAFRGCTSLAGIYLHSGITSVGDSAFVSCSRLTIFTSHASAPEGFSENWNYANRPVVYSCLDGGITYDGLGWVQTSDDTVKIFGYSGEATALTIPSEINGVSVKEITSYAFRGSGISYVSIPESITRISNYAFYDCTSLSRVEFDDPEGWQCASSAAATSGTELIKEDISQPNIAAIYLTSTYSKQHWFK